MGKLCVSFACVAKVGLSLLRLYDFTLLFLFLIFYCFSLLNESRVLIRVKRFVKKLSVGKKREKNRIERI